MIKKLYCVFDKKANTTQPVYECTNDLVAIRDFSMLCKNEKAEMISRFPEDYCLMCLGELDTDTGIIISSPKTIAEAKEYTAE